MYLNLETMQQCTERDIRAMFPNTGFGTPFVPPEQFVWVFPTPHPDHDTVIQAVRETTPELTSKGHWEQRWEIVPRFVDYTDLDGVLHSAAEQEAAAVTADAALKASRAREAAKAARQAAVEAITVTTQAGNTFDGDETSQGRMARAILAMQIAGASSTTWILADNAQATVTLAELSEALLLAGLEQTRLWVLP